MGSDREAKNGDEIQRLDFEWHPVKAAANLKKHKVSFDEAKTIFGDKKYLEVPDREHSFGEFRYLAIGRSERERLLTVVFTERGNRFAVDQRPDRRTVGKEGI